MVVATIAAVVAAFLFAAANALLHRSAGLVEEVTRSSQLGHFIANTARHPVWLLGMLANVTGFGLHALALNEGPLTLVQPLLVTGVVFALPLRRALEGRRPVRAELLWAAALAAGLGVFLLSATPAEGPSAAPDPLPTVLALVGVGGGIAVCALLGWRADGERSAAVLGVATGLAFAGTAGLLKEVMAQLGHGLLSVFAGWPLYGLAVAGICGLLLNQLAFQAAPLRASLPAITTVDPIVSLIIGVAVFDEPFRHSVPALSGEVAGLVLVVAAVVALTRGDPRLALSRADALEDEGAT